MLVYFKNDLGVRLLEHVRQIELIRYIEMKIYQHDAGIMTKMAAMPIYGKNLKNLRNQWTDFHITWYVASGTPAHYILFKL